MEQHMSNQTSKPLAVLAFSGGLDTSFCAAWLVDQGYTVHSVFVNTGGHSSADLARIQQRAMACGAIVHKTIDAREELFERHLKYLLFANARRGAGYPLCVSAERVCQAMHVAGYAVAQGAAALVHGSTGAGNDQLRFDTVFRVLAPDIKLLAPVRALALSRDAEVAYLAERNISVDAQTSSYSINAGMWGLSIGGVETHGSWGSLPAAAWPTGEVQSCSATRELLLSFQQGIPVALDGALMDPVSLIEMLNEIGVAYSVGRGMHLGDTVLGIKGRIGYSAPAAHILIEAHRELEKLTLSSSQQFWKETLGNLYGRMVHEAQGLDPLCRDLEALLESSQRMVSGDVRVGLAEGRMEILGSRSEHSLMDLQTAAYGEQASGWTGEEVAAHNKLRAQQLQLCWQQAHAKAQEAAQ
jgi:argininosuccinate synthase